MKYQWIRVICGKKTKNEASCKRYIAGWLGYNGAFEHKVFGYCDLRNEEWRCYQHSAIPEFGLSLYAEENRQDQHLKEINSPPLNQE